jgi:hypothetical protein
MLAATIEGTQTAVGDKVADPGIDGAATDPGVGVRPGWKGRPASSPRLSRFANMAPRFDEIRGIHRAAAQQHFVMQMIARGPPRPPDLSSSLHPGAQPRCRKQNVKSDAAERKEIHPLARQFSCGSP